MKYIVLPHVGVPSVGGPHSISWRLEKNKKADHLPIKKRIPARQPLNWDNSFFPAFSL